MDFMNNLININKSYLIPKSPVKAAYASCFYISLLPNLILVFIPNQISKNAELILGSFALGSLLGDLMFHLLPHVYSNDKNVLISGSYLFIGYMTFFFLEKIINLNNKEKGITLKKDIASSKSEFLKPNKIPEEVTSETRKSNSQLNILADFIHNFTDGIAIMSAYQADYLIGTTTTIAIMFHEIPHELSDFLILRKAGYTMIEALMTQFLTAIGAFLGCSFCYFVTFYAKNNISFINVAQTNDIFISFAAGGFIYISTVGLTNSLIVEDESSKSTHSSLVSLLNQLLAASLGALIMFFIAYYE